MIERTKTNDLCPAFFPPKNYLLHKKVFRDAEIFLVDYNAIKIENVAVKMPETVENGLFTSKNAVKSVLNDSANGKRSRFAFV